MKRLALILAGVAVAGGAAATPAVAGLAGNPSFSHEIPVPVPSAAKTPQFADDHSRGRSPDGATGPAGTGPAAAASQPGDDRGGIAPHAEPGDDRSGGTARAEAGDDRGGQPADAEPGDDHGGRSPGAEPGDDSGGHSGGRG